MSKNRKISASEGIPKENIVISEIPLARLEKAADAESRQESLAEDYRD